MVVQLVLLLVLLTHQQFLGSAFRSPPSLLPGWKTNTNQNPIVEESNATWIVEENSESNGGGSDGQWGQGGVVQNNGGGSDGQWGQGGVVQSDGGGSDEQWGQGGVVQSDGGGSDEQWGQGGVVQNDGDGDGDGSGVPDRGSPLNGNGGDSEVVKEILALVDEALQDQEPHVDTRTIVVSNPFLSREMALQDLERTMQEITSFNLCFENTLNEAVRDELQENGYNVASTTNYLIVSGWHDPIKCNAVFNLNKVKQKRRQVVPDGYTCLEQNGKIVGICAISCFRGRRCPEICSPNKVVDIPQKFRNYRLTIRFVNGMESISDEKWTEILSRVQIALKQDKNMKTFEKFSSMLEGNPFIIE
ncbi:hypothetical protein RB195_016656 [Necator americanus]|uniref:Uncharacterized protein n=1 Tax=Necator americanus TaxID=51031 RepID=A0ABR1C417_NECAM